MTAAPGGTGDLSGILSRIATNGSMANQQLGQLIQAIDGLQLSGTVQVSQGGTGQTSLTLNGVVYGNGTAGVGVTTQGPANSILTANAGAPSFSASPTVGTSLTTPLVMGGTAASSALTLQSTSGIGTSDTILLKVGNNGATTAATIASTGSFLSLGAGTTAIAPFKLTSGTNLTTAAAGAFEFDGTCIYGTAAASSRQVVNTEQFVTVQGSDVSLSNSSTSAQNVFASANDVLQLAASTTYQFETLLYIATGTTTHTTALGFVASSAFTSIRYWAELWSTTSGTINTTAPSVLDVAASTATVLNATSVAPFTVIRARGLIRTNSASTVTPQITFNAGPTGTCATKTESYFRIWPIGSSSVAAVGNWS